jgi:glycosyltransferase involved in cell wall biosynthesis
MEAMAWGRPVVATRVGGVPDLVKPECGVLVDDGDSDALAAALRALSADPERVSRMGAAARDHARAEFSLRREAVLMGAFYEALLGPDRLPPARS